MEMNSVGVLLMALYVFLIAIYILGAYIKYKDFTAIHTTYSPELKHLEEEERHRTAWIKWWYFLNPRFNGW